MGPVPEARKPDFVVCEQQRHRSACAFAQSDKHLCYSQSGKDNCPTSSMQNFKILAVLVAEQTGIGPYLVRNPKDSFSCVEVQILLQQCSLMWLL